MQLHGATNSKGRTSFESDKMNRSLFYTLVVLLVAASASADLLCLTNLGLSLVSPPDSALTRSLQNAKKPACARFAIPLV